MRLPWSLTLRTFTAIKVCEGDLRLISLKTLIKINNRSSNSVNILSLNYPMVFNKESTSLLTIQINKKKI